MDSTRKTPIGRALRFSLIASLLYSLSLPPFEMGPLAFAVGFPLTLAFLDPDRPLPWRQALLASFVFGEVTTAAVGGYWLFHAVHGFFGRSFAFSAAFTLATTITHAGIFLAAAVFAASVLARLSAPWRIVGFASAWVAMEFLRSNLLYGCPWDLLGHAFSRSPLLMQVTSIGGVYLLGWMAIAAAAAAATALIERRRGRPFVTYLACAAALPMAAAVFGYHTIHQAAGAAVNGGPTRPARPLTVGIVQTDIGKHDLWQPGSGPRHLETFLAQSEASTLAGVDLLVWSENAVPFLLDADLDAQRRIQALADRSGATILLGAPRSQPVADGRAELRNSVYLFRPDADGYQTYDKVRLLPYIEEIPAFAAPFVARSHGLEYRPGSSASTFEVAGWRIAPLICFESTYPQFARALAAAGADLFVNVSNDSWFDRGAAPEQHFAMSVFRAPENRVPLVRVANGGVSAVVDAFGRPAARVPPRATAVAKVELLPGPSATTFYTRHGDVFAWAASSLAAVCLILAAARARKDRQRAFTQ